MSMRETEVTVFAEGYKKIQEMLEEALDAREAEVVERERRRIYPTGEIPRGVDHETVVASIDEEVESWAGGTETRKSLTEYGWFKTVAVRLGVRDESAAEALWSNVAERNPDLSPEAVSLLILKKLATA